MAIRSGVLKLVSLMVVCMVLGAPMASASISCNQVVSTLTPCLSYVQNGGAVPATCCNGIKTLYGAAQTKADRQSVCGCLKNLASAASGSYLGRAAGLPAKCGVNLPYKIDPKTNCNEIQ